jgi:hypothetical protein
MVALLKDFIRRDEARSSEEGVAGLQRERLAMGPAGSPCTVNSAASLLRQRVVRSAEESHRLTQKLIASVACDCDSDCHNYSGPG